MIFHNTDTPWSISAVESKEDVIYFLAIILAITGVLNPVAGALVHNCGSVLVIINSALLLRWNKK